VSSFRTNTPDSINQKQSRLLQLAAVFLFLYSVILTAAPAVRMHTWQTAYRYNHWLGYAVWLVIVVAVGVQLARFLPERDPYIFPAAALLTGWGLLTIWRLDAVMGSRQTLWLIVSMVAFSAGLRVHDPLALLRRYKYLWLTSGLLLTGLTFLFGVYPGGVGPRLWLGCCGVYLQPSEPLKLLLIIYLAAYLSDRLPISFGLLQLLAPTLILIGLALALLVAQRDLGTASLFILIYTLVVYLASQRKRALGFSLLVLLAAGGTGYMLFDVVRIRVDAWLNPWLDPAGRSYQIIQSILAVAAGGLLGQGPGLGSPGVVPVSHSDFIFSALAEETGLMGVIGLLLLFALLLGRGFRAALFASSNYRRYLAAGITGYLIMQTILITGGNLRLLPLTGVTLPFVSYGGSSLLTSYLALLILITISSQDPEDISPLRSPTPYLLTAGAMLAALIGLALVAGWWSVARREDLLLRPENPRPIITQRFVQRGALFDRNGAPVNLSSGSPGAFAREYRYPALSSTTGYTSAIYGKAGLEAGLDDILSGLRGHPEGQIWLSALLYGQSPPGLDARLSIDLALQKEADTLLAGKHGALVLIHAASGEVLAIASHPYVNPNTIESGWLDVLQDPDAPLLNRATQASYPPGGALGPFLLAYAAQQNRLPALPGGETITIQGMRLRCAVVPDGSAPGDLIRAGCPAAQLTLGRQMEEGEWKALVDSLGFTSAPALPVLTANPSTAAIRNSDLAVLGQDLLTVSPMQMALAAAALSQNGLRPTPRLVISTSSPESGWQSQAAEAPHATLLETGAARAAEAMAVPGADTWQVVGFARASRDDLVWYLAGTLPEWEGEPLALALVLEGQGPETAERIGRSLLEKARFFEPSTSP
jgi:cell division protein FtsW (lipid II flippase)